MKRLLLKAIFLLGIAASVSADEIKVSRIIPTGENLQIYDESESPAPVKRIAAQLRQPVYSLGRAPTYDLREAVKINGVEVAAEDVLFYAADTQLIYVRASKENVELIETLYSTHDHVPVAYEVALTVLGDGGKGEKEDKRLALFRFNTVSGGANEVAVAKRDQPSAEKKMSFSVVVGPDGRHAEFVLSGKLPLFDEDVALSLNTIAEVNKTVTVYEQSKESDTHSALRLQLLITPKYSREQLEQTEEWQARKIKEVEAELARKPDLGGLPR